MISVFSMVASSKGGSSCVQRSSNAYSVPFTRVTRTRYPSTSASIRELDSSSAMLPMSVQPDMGLLEHPCLQAGRLGHHRLIPGRVEHQLDVRPGHRRDDFQLLFNVLHQDVSHAATR